MTSNTRGLHRTREQISVAKRRELIVKSYEHTVRTLLSLMTRMFNGIDDTLFELANNAKTNSDQSRYFEAMREARIKRKALEAAFKQTLGKYFKDPATAPTHYQQPDSADSLQLVNNSTLERQVALESISNRCKADHKGLLLECNARLQKLYNLQEGSTSNPADPMAITLAFASACDLLDTDDKIKQVIYKLFEQHVLNQYEHIIEPTNTLLLSSGILPNLHIEKARKTQTTTQTESKSNSQTQPKYQPQNTVAFDQLRQLLAQWRKYSPQPDMQPISYSANTQGITPLEAGQLVSMISSLEQAIPNDLLNASQPQTVNIRNAISQILNTHNQTEKNKLGLNQVDEDIINLVSMLFDFILEDSNLSSPIQVLICRLQIPILKVVIKDHDFFSKPKHPARQLLNALAKAGIGWNNRDERKRDKLYEKIHDTVHTVLNEFDGDIMLFEHLYHDFSQFIERENRRARIIEQRTKEAEIGRIKSSNAQKRVERVINERLNMNELPQSAIDIIRNGWSRVMFLACLKDQSGAQWDNRLQTLNDLIWCLTPPLNAEAKEIWGTKTPHMLKDLKAGLQEISYNTDRLEENLRTLKQELTEAFKSERSYQKYEEHVHKAHTEEKDEILESQEAINESILQRFLAKVDTIEAGTWVEFSLINGSKFRCKLATIIEDADCYIFINRMGLKVIEKSRLELAQEIQQGRLTILEQALLVDRAMNSVMSNLRRFSKQTA